MDQTGNTGNAFLHNAQRGPGSACCVCHLPTGKLFEALDRRYHRECFRCVTCNERIDPNDMFAFSRDSRGERLPHHRKCFAQTFGIICAVCNAPIPASKDGTVSFVKHPFFDKEQMCPRHAGTPGRRCTGCHRFEPKREPFADLNDGGRCVCFACCRTVIVDNNDLNPLWLRILSFFENKLKLPIWQDMRDVPILVVGSDALNDHMKRLGSVHRGSSQIMTRGLCLTSHHENCMRFKLPSMRFNESSSTFDPLDDDSTGFTYFEVPPDGIDGRARNPTANVFAILCLSGLPRDLTAGILAHEAAHAWIKLHPKYDFRKPLHPQVEEGVAQLISMLFLNDGLGPADTACPMGSNGPSDEKLRQYFKFSIETDESEIHGTGYRRAAVAYRDIGIEALMDHVVRYRKFPAT